MCSELGTDILLFASFALARGSVLSEALQVRWSSSLCCFPLHMLSLVVASLFWMPLIVVLVQNLGLCCKVKSKDHDQVTTDGRDGVNRTCVISL